jgi:hypothetical protein
VNEILRRAVTTVVPQAEGSPGAEEEQQRVLARVLGGFEEDAQAKAFAQASSQRSFPLSGSICSLIP